MQPTKATDSRAKGFNGDSVEVDAIAPPRLRALLRKAIESHINPDAWERTQRIEAEEQYTLERLIAGLHLEN